MSSDELRNLNAKIYRGLEISFQKLVGKLSVKDEELVVLKHGKVVRIKARDIGKGNLIQ